MTQGTTFHLTDLPERIRKRTTIDPESGCWCCSLSLDKDGYSRIGGRGTHRFVYQLLVGEIPPERPVLDHVKERGCVWRNCIWPAHLEPVTVRINTLRGSSFSAVNAVKTHCLCGLEYDMWNTYWCPDGSRDCRSCVRRRVREYKQRLAGRTDLRMAA